MSTCFVTCVRVYNTSRKRCSYNASNLSPGRRCVTQGAGHSVNHAPRHRRHPHTQRRLLLARASRRSIEHSAESQTRQSCHQAPISPPPPDVIHGFVRSTKRETWSCARPGFCSVPTDAAVRESADARPLHPPPTPVPSCVCALPAACSRPPATLMFTKGEACSQSKSSSSTGLFLKSHSAR